MAAGRLRGEDVGQVWKRVRSSASLDRSPLCRPETDRTHIAAAALWLVCAYLLAGCAWSPVEPYTGEAPKRETLYVIANGWHTEIVFPRMP